MGSLISILLAVVFLEKADNLTFDEKRIPDAQILTGDVCFRHDSMRIYCDSAYFFNENNSLRAMGHVHMVQGDTLEGRCSWAYYHGDIKVAEMHDDVWLYHGGTILTTDNMDYDRAHDQCYYYKGGQIQDSVNTLTSITGVYLTKSKQAIFEQDVHLVNDRFTLDADTLHYNTESKIANLVCPTTIVYDSTTILSRNGWYNTENERSMLYDRSLILQADGRQMTADTIYYDKKVGYGMLTSALEIHDTIQHMILTGDLGEAWEQHKRGYVTRHAQLYEYSNDTTPTYVHADSIWATQIPYTFIRMDQEIDSTYLEVRAYHNVRAWNRDVQAVCDSMVYIGRDSIVSLYTHPILWREDLQVSADTMHIYFRDSKMDHAVGIGNGLAIQDCEYDSTGIFYNQICGKEWIAYVRDGELKEVDFSGNAETVFYPDDQGEYIGMNVSQSSYAFVYIENRHIHHILFTTETTGTMFPLDQVPEDKRHLVQFFWADIERPSSAADIFRVVPFTKRPARTAISATNEEEVSKPRVSRREKLKKK